MFFQHLDRMATERRIQYYDRTRRPKRDSLTYFPDRSALSPGPGPYGFRSPTACGCSVVGRHVWKIPTHDGEMVCAEVATSECVGSTHGGGIMGEEIAIVTFIVDSLSSISFAFLTCIVLVCSLLGLVCGKSPWDISSSTLTLSLSTLCPCRFSSR